MRKWAVIMSAVAGVAIAGAVITLLAVAKLPDFTLEFDDDL